MRRPTVVLVRVVAVWFAGLSLTVKILWLFAAFEAFAVGARLLA